MLLNTQYVNKEIKEEIKRYPEINKNGNTMVQKSMGHSRSSPKREIYSNTGLPQETKNISRKQYNFIPKGTRKKKQSPKLVEGRI